MTKEEYKRKFEEDEAVGWLSLDKLTEKLYPNQEPKHYGTVIKYMLGGEDPLDGVSIYESKNQNNHYHFVSYGMSNLYYDLDNCEEEFSGWGFEFTFRLIPFEEDNEDPKWVISLMQNLAKYVFNSKKWFEEYHFIPANGPIRLNTETNIIAIAFVEDPEMGTIKTPNGNVQFLQMVGITTEEYEQLKQNPKTGETKIVLDRLKKENPLLITDLKRK
ncbi:suppressor of fused domain protein [Aquimarina sp. AD1]|uniref:suppressor of fused domain protein n=1 Tax=Aquimarina sp. (strain AD1) TaxID=1714848 RepID=UPI000E48EA82|nr:suppressor of fused domain protein [Aquimarina sp. AD1]AXT54449.1 suppressor of fused domain protein [Aquimarina sp. AD1]RKN36749.1 suppressor of fused domain protein [Aquimarina sp. AD1]